MLKNKISIAVFYTAFFISSAIHLVQSTIMDKLRDDPDLSQMASQFGQILQLTTEGGDNVSGNIILAEEDVDGTLTFVIENNNDTNLKVKDLICKQFGFDELIFKRVIDNDFDIESLLVATDAEINDLFPAPLLGTRAKFKFQLNLWRKNASCQVPSNCREWIQSITLSENKVPAETYSSAMSPSSSQLSFGDETYNLNKFSLQDLLNKTEKGIGILDFYKKEQFLDEHNKTMLISIIVENYSENFKEMSMKDIESVASAIQSIFPSEDKQYYLHKRGHGLNPTGKLHDKAVNARLKLRSLKRKKDQELVEEENPHPDNIESSTKSEELLSSDIEETIIWLTHNNEPWNEVQEKWRKVLKQRQKDILTGFANILTKWPLLKHALGHTLIEIDYDTIKSLNKSHIFELWPSFVDKIIPYLKRKIRDKTSLSLLKELEKDINENSRDFIIFNLIHALLKPPMISVGKKNAKKSKWKPSIKDAQDSCFLYCSTAAQYTDKFYTLLEQNPIANSTLALRSVTIFVPTNEAFQRHHASNTSVLYHMATVAFNQEQLPKTVPSDMDGNPPLYITKKNTGDIYVNNARIIPSLSLQMENSVGKRQVMHVIDDVLTPLSVLPTSKSEIINPDALQFLQQADSMSIGDFRLRSYRAQVTLMKKENLYSAAGGHTFLIPIDEGFKQTTRSSLVDKKVIDGHVIPHNVIFTAPAPIEMPQTTASFEDNIRVTVSFFQQKDGKMYVKSNTRIGDAKHSKGVVLAEIVKANIPVRNGVVHLIHRPLMIVDTTVSQFLQSFKIVNDNENGALRKFYEVIMDIGGEVLDDINKLGEVTILAPSNEAWNQSFINNIIRNREKMREILNMHIIKDRLNVEKIRQKNQNMIAQVPTVNNRTFLYFNIRGDNADEVITVEGGGVNATIIQADVAQLNGFVHIIDKVLGVPYTTVLGKLETDPMLSDTYTLSKMSDFNVQLNNTQRRYTFFVPRDMAWQKTQFDYPSAHKKLFMRDFAYHSKSILERHLVISDRTFTMKELATMTEESDSIVLPTFRDSLKMKVHEELGRLHDDYEDHEWTGYYIQWNLKKINVYRPDVECTNGIIHVIDYPFLEEKDVVVSGGTYRTQMNLAFFIANLLLVSVAKVL